MQSLAWKLAVLAAVVGVGFLVILQAQRGMKEVALKKKSDVQSGADTAANSASKGAAEEPMPAAGSKSPETAPLQPELADQGKNTAEPAHSDHQHPTTADLKGPARQDPRDLSAADKNPFGDVDLSGQSAANPNPARSVARADKEAAAPKPDLMQAGALDDAKPLNPPGSPDKNAKPKDASGKGANDASPGSLANADANNSNSKSAKNPPPQSEPGAPGQSEPRLDATSGGGPQLFVPGTGPGPSPPSAGSSPSSTAANNNFPAAPSHQNEPKSNGSSPSPKPDTPPGFTELENAGNGAVAGKNGDSPFGNESPKPSSPKGAGGDGGPALNAASEKDPQAGRAALSASGQPPAADKASLKTAANEPGAPGDHPQLFPEELGKERPLPKKPELAATSDTSASPTVRRAPADSHAETAADFQGDGTVNESAPLGPQRPQLNIEKVAPQNALLGQPLVYSILVKNVGLSEARDVTVEDRIPKGSKLSGTIPRAELNEKKKLVWHLGNIAPGDQRKIQVRVVPLEAGEIGSVATVNFVAEAAAETVVTAPRLEFELSAPSTARLGEMVPFHFKVRNVGTGEARAVVIRDLIPQGLSHSAGSDLEYEVGRLPPGSSKELTLELKTVKVGQTTNRAVATGEGGLSVEARAEIEVSGSKVALARSGPSRRYLGRTAVFSNTLVNESKYAVEGIVVVESVPPGMEFNGATHGGQYNEGTRTIAWRIDHMGPGETRVVKSKLLPRAAGNQTGTVRVSVPNGEPIEASSETLVEGFAALGMDVPPLDSPIDQGEKITFRVNARNKGTIAATNVIVTVEIPEQMAVISARGPGTHAQEGNQVRFGPIPTLEGRTAAACEIVLEARKRGDSRIKVSVRADQMDKPLVREESILILAETPEPAAAR